MSVAELAPHGGEFERTPPHDLAAEQCVLGGMLMSKDAISDVMEVISPPDHYRPAHQLVHEAILELYGRGEPADPVTVSDLLAKRGELARIGGGAYLHTLLASVPTAANAGYYARIVRERAILRRLVEAGTRIVQLGYTGDGDADELVDRAEAEIYGVTERRVSEDFLPLSEIMPGALDEIEAIGSRGGMMTGVPTGFSSLDSLTNGLHPGQMVVIAARPAIGKALAVNTPLPTPGGWTTMGEVQVGDHLIGADGKPVRVVATTEILHGRPCFEVEFDDRSKIVADAEHQWRTTTRASRQQASQRVTRYYWSDKQVQHVKRLATEAASGLDRRVTTTELLNEAGQEFSTILKTAVIRKVRPLGRDIRTTRRRMGRLGDVREYPMPLPVYSRRELLSTLATHIATPKLAAQSHRHEETKTTAHIAATLYHVTPSQRRWNHAVPVCPPMDLPDQQFPLSPYVLGIWLGDGSSAGARYTSADPEIALYFEDDGLQVTHLGGYIYSFGIPPVKQYPVEKACAVCGTSFMPKNIRVRTCGRTCGGRLGRRGIQSVQPTCRLCQVPITGTLPGYLMCLPCLNRTSATGVLRELGVLDNKHIPVQYLRASESQRRALLAGLLDTDGTVSRTGSVQFSVTSHRLAEDVRELICSLGYRCGWTEKKVKGRSPESSTAYTITFTTTDDVFRLERKRITHKERRPAAVTPRVRQRFITAVRPVASVPVRCVQVAREDGMYLAGRSMIPTHNSTLALDLARAAAVKHGQATVMFSLEMSRNEITMRLLSAESRVALHHMRTGQLGEDDWTRLARRMSEVVDAPLFIDDSPNMSMMEIRAKCRRLKQRHSLRLVIIDYLQLMSSPRRVENRQQEVSDMSRSLKLLAKELDVPVVAVSQLNRGPEQRNDKRPLLSDLRESGCMTQDTTVLRADTGAPITFRELLDKGHEGVSVWAMDDQHHLVPSPITKVFPSGTKNVYRLRLASGREVKASGNHPFLTFAGWVPLDGLTIGERIGIPRSVPEPLNAGIGWSEYRLGLLAHLMGDGCVLRTQPVHYTSNDQANLAFVEAAAAAEFGITPRRVQQKTWWHVYLPAPYRCTHGRWNPIHVWFRELGIEDLRSYQKRIPEVIYSASNQEVATFLRHLWATDGNVTLRKRKSAAKVYYASSSRELAYGVALLLARLGIIARVRQVQKAGYRSGYHVIVADGPSLRRFCRDVGVHGRRGELAGQLLTSLDGQAVNTNVDTLPLEVWDLVKSERIRQGMTERQLQAGIQLSYCGSTLYKTCPSRERLLRIADALDSDRLRAVARTDIFWDRIVAIEPLGLQKVYDATVKGTHNFIADGILAHNSIEQDSDVVILLHREDAYERESPRAGEADLIVAKHRNGPTATVTVAFQGHYSRFVDMAPG